MKALQPQLIPEDKDLMGKLLSAGRIEQKYARRLQTVLLRARGKGTGEIADFLGIQQGTVSLYIKRYNNFGIDSLLRDKTRKPGKEPVSRELKNEICRIACSEKPENETHWSTRTLARRVGISHAAVSQILRECGLKPHKVARRNYSSDPEFEAKLTDVVGLYLKPPDNASVDEKTQMQALERSQPMLRNVPERQTVDYMRHGTTTLFAALDVLSGNAIGECRERHTSADYIEFLKKIDKACEAGKALHIVADNLTTHKTKAVREYLESVP